MCVFSWGLKARLKNCRAWNSLEAWQFDMIDSRRTNISGLNMNFENHHLMRALKLKYCDMFFMSTKSLNSHSKLKILNIISASISTKSSNLSSALCLREFQNGNQMFEQIVGIHKSWFMLKHVHLKFWASKEQRSCDPEKKILFILAIFSNFYTQAFLLFMAAQLKTQSQKPKIFFLLP